jgi:hypothetical protein
MALNPFFLQGSQTEQRLVQELINEQLRMYGVDITYIPRKFVKKDSILREIQSSKFDDNYIIEAYVNTYEGHSGSGDILTKFGISLRDELTITISRERYEDFISPFLEAESDDEIVLSSRPREGDLVYFPLGQRLFEVKFVEHEDPFYQLGKNYVYQLKCELFEYEDEVIDTSIDEIDEQVQEEGYITTLTLLGIGATATASALINSGYVREVFLNNDGSGYTSTPVIRFTDAPDVTGSTATAVAITTSRAGVFSIQEIRLTNAGFGYTEAPTIYIEGGGGTGAAATCSIETTQNGVISLSVDGGGSGYVVAPTVTITPPVGAGATASSTINGIGSVTGATVFSGGNFYLPSTTVSVTFAAPVGVGTTAEGTAHTNSVGVVTGITITNSGSGYATAPVVSIGNSAADKQYTNTLTGLSTATAVAGISTGGIVTAIRITNPGYGYSSTPTVTIGNPSLIAGIGTYQFNEEVVGSSSGTRARVKSWDDTTNLLKVSNVSGTFTLGETLIGVGSSATFSIKEHSQDDIYDKYTQNDEIETEADLILDFTQSNPFGSY